MRREQLYLVDIVGAAQAIARFLKGVTRESFLSDDLVQSAVLQKLMIIGEAAARLPAEFKALHSDVPWADMIGFRNVAIHGYFTMKWSIVWTIAAQQAPDLRRKVEAILLREYS